ncbi:MAG TPA: UDP-3-O-(3-hydroxymyristoyl)glucosamine N-acyltransferase [Lichenihabitans sp.]|jgi:UDP-3-O-[3-hydroxymyristoyl] glucosamine N-acyltransferase|nr:UDP-3-O-(3-hydroxymyristoyl)glucosamine N-acyltransferase [Lichenihabitans sp.]
MNQPLFHRAACTPTLADVLAWTGATATPGADLHRTVDTVAPLDQARPGALTFLDNPKYAALLTQTRATACLVSARHADRLPAGVVALVVDEPYRAFAIVVGKLFPAALRPGSAFGAAGIAPGAVVHPEARLESGVTLDPGAIVGARAEIGSGTVVGAHAVVGADVRIGRDCAIGPHASITYALLGNRVIIHAGVRIGQDGFGFAMGPQGHLKVPQIGRVVIQDDVEIGANATIDRGSNKDTVIGEGTKIDNLVQIGHNVSLGRHCVIVSQTGISGSTTLGDFAVTGGQAGLAGHLTVGAGAQIGAKSGVMNDVPAGERWFGIPAQSAREEFRLQATLRRLARRGTTDKAGSQDKGPT